LKNTIAVWIGIISVLSIWGGAAPEGEPTQEVLYPYQFEIQDGSYAWLVTPESAEKTTHLVFDWKADRNILTVNGAQVYPGWAEPSQPRTEAELETIFGDDPTVRRFRDKFGNWEAAVDTFNSLDITFRDDIRARCSLLESGKLSQDDVRAFVDIKLSQPPLSDMFSREKGVEFREKYLAPQQNSWVKTQSFPR